MISPAFLSEAGSQTPRLSSAHQCYYFINPSLIGTITLLLMISSQVLARTITYDGSEVQVYVTVGEPTSVSFPSEIKGGFLSADSAVSLKRVGSDLIIFAQRSLPDKGESILVRLIDAQNYHLRILPASEKKKDLSLTIEDPYLGADTF